MRIIHITNHFLPYAGGVQWSVLRTAEALASRGHDVTVLTETPAREGWRDDDLPFRVIRFRVPVWRPLTRLLYWRWMWTRRHMLRDADVLHFHDYTPLIHWFLPLRMLIRAPLYAITFHGYEHWPIRRRYRLLRSLAARLCTSRFAVGEYVRELYGHPVDEVYLGAPVHRRPVMPRTKAMRFGYAGRLEADTDILQVAVAIAECCREHDVDAELDIAGDGTLRPRIEALGHTRFHVRVRGMMVDPEPVIRDARWLIATGFLGILEGFTTGKPVLVPALNGIRRRYVRSIPDHRSVMTVAESQDELRAVMAGIFTGRMEEELQRRADAALRFVSEQTWDNIALMLEKHYRRETA